MIYYDHGMLGATVGVAAGAQRRYGWPVILLAALAGMFPDWDAAAIHISAETYQIGHRVWGHNLFAVTLAGLALGGAGYLIHQSAPSATTDATSTPESCRPWLALGVLILWIHTFMDVLYCSWDRTTNWPVALLWPVVGDGVGMPCMRWSDNGATFILLSGLLVCVAIRRHRQSWACVSLLVLAIYVMLQGVRLHWS
jgi:hypothetical protein